MSSSSDEGSDKSSKEKRSVVPPPRKGLSARPTITTTTTTSSLSSSILKESKSRERESSGSISKHGALKKKSSSSTKSSLSSSSRRSDKNEICFEERRAQSKYYKLHSSENNFNLLERSQMEQYDKENQYEESFAQMDESSSIEEVDMEEETNEGLEMLQNLRIGDENKDPKVLHPSNNLLNVTTFDEKRNALNITTLHATVSDSVTKRSNPRKVLFDVNTSVDSRSIVSAANNISTNSSILNENDAVGIHDKEEETVNTKFAARELSMMFSSPGVLNGSLHESHLDKHSKKTDSNRLLFSVHRNNSQNMNVSHYSSKEEQENMLNMFRDQDCDKENNRGVFKIFEEDAPSHSGESERDSDCDHENVGGFKIFEEDTSTHNDTNGEVVQALGTHCNSDRNNNCDKENMGVFKIFEDDASIHDNRVQGLGTHHESDHDSDSDSDSGLQSEDRGNGDTASISDLVALLQNENRNSSMTEIQKKEKLGVEGIGLDIYCDDQESLNDGQKSVCCEIDDGTVLTEDEAAFGDISFIPHKDNTIDLEGRVRRMRLTDRL